MRFSFTDEPQTIPALLFQSAARYGSQPSIVDATAGVTLDFNQLRDAAIVAARALMGLGIAHGDRVAIWAPNCSEWVVAALGLQLAGGVLVPLNTRFKGREAAFVLAKSRARVLVTMNGFLGVDYVARLREACGGTSDVRPVEGLSCLEAIIVLRGAAPSGTLSFAELLSGVGLASEDAALARAHAVAPDDLADIVFTSGTTGHPKGVMCTHAQNLRAFRAWCEVVDLRAGDRYLIVNPYFHSFGYKAGWLACLMAGAVNYPQPVFDVAETLARIGRDRITVLPGPPSLYTSILDHPDRDQYDLSSLRLAVTGAATIPVTLISRMQRELGIDTVLTAYGLTECSGVATMCRRGDNAETIATTSGRAIPGIEVRVVATDGSEAKTGQPGEVLVRGYNVMRGYDGEPAETSAAIDEHGWLHTGDVGVMDKEGNLRITDRMKDMYIIGGFNAYPAEIENQLLRHPKIAQAAVVGIPDERMGEVGMAFVVLRPGEEASAEELIDWSRTEMANYKVPRFVEIVENLPMSAVGKVLKYELRAIGATRVRSEEGRRPADKKVQLV